MELPSSKVATLLLRGLTLAFLALTVLTLFINKRTIYGNYVLTFREFVSYKFMLGTSFIGIGYSLLQGIAFVIFQMLTNNDIYLLVQFYGDKVISCLLAMGSAAGLGATIDLQHLHYEGDDPNSFYNLGYISAILLFLGFLCTAILSVLSSYAL